MHDLNGMTSRRGKLGAAQGNLLTCGMGYQVVSALDVTYGGVDEVRE